MILKGYYVWILSSIFATTPLYAAALEKDGHPSLITVNASLLYLKPVSNTLRYAALVYGPQPYSQSWSYQQITPAYSPAFEVGMNYGFANSSYQVSTEWLHLHTNDSSTLSASSAQDTRTIQFISPPYDVGPSLIGIKKALGQSSFDFDNVELNIGKSIDAGYGIQATVFGGLNFIHLNQILTTTFTDNIGGDITALTYATVPDPGFYLQGQNTSNYNGAGPDLGIEAQYKMKYGFGVLMRALGSLTVGSVSLTDVFHARSVRLSEIGIAESFQQLTTPSMTQVVPGFDGKLGLSYDGVWKGSSTYSIELGYRVSSYLNAISQVNPTTLVQSGKTTSAPEFATGTLAIGSVGVTQSAFNMNGPYLNLKVQIS